MLTVKSIGVNKDVFFVSDVSAKCFESKWIDFGRLWAAEHHNDISSSLLSSYKVIRELMLAHKF